jgi:CubicO group peptidase (beta-lactamase class C family)
MDALSETRLARFRPVLDGYVQRDELPGLVALVSRREKTHVEALGTKAVGDADPVKRDSIFRISSMTKPVTAAAAMMLVEECKLRLDDPVDAWLPELANRRVLERWDGPLEATVPAARPIRVRDLLALTMGIGIPFAPPGSTPIQRAMEELELGQGPPDPTKPPEPEEWMRRLGTLPLMRQPGEAWIYSTGLDVLGVLLSRVSGQPLETFLDARIFRPLEMKDTGFSVPSGKLDRFTTCYGTDPKTGKRSVYDDPRSGGWSVPPKFPAGAAGLVSTVDDYLAFARMLAHGGRHGNDRLLARGSVEAMLTDQLTPGQKAAAVWVPGFFERGTWGLGVWTATVRSDLGASVGAYGWDGGLGSLWRNDPREELTMILLTNQSWSSPNPPNVARDFETLAYQSIDV